MNKFITECPGCGNGQIFGRMSEWWCGNTECDVKWGNDEAKDNNQ